MPDLKRRSVSTVVVGAACALLAGIWIAVAQTVPPRLIPYEGYLDQDGTPVTTPEGQGLTMTFGLYTVATGGAAAWQEAHANVPVRAGRFAVTLGGQTTIPDTLFLAPALYVGVSVGGVPLSGRQRVLSAPQAVTAAQAQTLNVAGAATVGGNLTVGGVANVSGNLTSSGTVQGATLNVTGNATVSGTLSGRVAGGYVLRMSGNSAILYECTPWGQGACNPARCLRGTARPTLDGICYVPQLGGNGYCYGVICVE